MRWDAYLHRTYGPVRMGLLAVDTALDHASHHPACWDYTADSYGRRYARSFQARVVKNSVELAAGLLTGEDLRYRRSQSRSFQGRVWNAVRSSVTAQMPDGTRRPAYSRFLASEIATASVAPWTRQSIRPRWLTESLGWSALDQVQTNLLDEFGPDIRRKGIGLWKRLRPR